MKAGVNKVAYQVCLVNKVKIHANMIGNKVTTRVNMIHKKVAVHVNITCE